MGPGNPVIGTVGKPGKSCLGLRASGSFFAVTLSEGVRVVAGVEGRRFEIVNSGEAFPELPITV